MADLLEQIEEEINNYHSLEELRINFIENGYLEKDIDEAIQKLTHSDDHRSAHHKNTIKVFTIKEILDRIGYGFVSHQFINILFAFTGAGYFLIGLINGLKAILSIIFSSFLQDYARLHDVSKGFMTKSGIAFGFSFIFMAVAISLRLPWLFALSLLLGTFGVISYGDLFNKHLRETIKKEKLTHFLARVSYYGIIITGIAMLISGKIMDAFPATGEKTVMIFGSEMPFYGYLISFEVAAFVFILSGYFLSFLKYKSEKKYKLRSFFPQYFKRVSEKLSQFAQNKLIMLMLVAMVITGAVQILGNSYYGIYIYNNFKNVGLGGFMNVAFIFSLALLISFIGPFLTKKLHKHLGLGPLLVFGTLLMALMPATIAFNPQLVAIGVANALSILGGVIVGMAHNFLAHKILSERSREQYYASLGLATIIPFFILIPTGAYLGSELGLQTLFAGIAGILVLIVVPLYIGLVVAHKH
ncbi:MFS transporter [Candidatus Woesearchaeota archaeon]|nr:MFS transporter [Candidatus Woesearchaeota archaeon]